MPFGLKNSPSTFQHLVDRALTGLQNIELFVYMDDIVIYAKTLKEHTRKLNALLEKLDKAKLTLQPEKCLFLRKEVTYLGHVITQNGVKPDPKKVDAVRKFPRTPRNIKQFLGLAGYYRKFIPDFSTIAKPLSHLLKKDVKFRWTESQDQAFNKLKDILCTQPLLQYPDFTKDFIVTTDASHYGIGGVLSQNFDGKFLPVAYTSRTLIDAEINYSTIEKELLGILFSVESFRPYLFGRQFKLEIDHKPLIWLHNMKNPNSRLLRWRHRLSEYNHNIEYIKAKKNVGADALSRNPSDINEEILQGITNDITLNDEVDPLEINPTPLHKVNSTPVFPENSLDEFESDARIEAVFLNIHWEGYTNDSKNSNDYSKFDETVSCEKSLTTGKEISGSNLIDANKSINVDCSHELVTLQFDCGTALVNTERSLPLATDSLDGKILPETRSIVNEINYISDDNYHSDFESETSYETTQTDRLQCILNVKNKDNSFIVTKTQIKLFNCYNLDRNNTSQDDSTLNPHFSCITISKDNLYMRDDNIAIFIPADVKFTTETNKDLLTTNIMKIEDLLNKDSNVVVFKYKKHCVLNMIIKPTYDSKPTYTDVVSTLKALKVAMDQLSIDSVSISRVGNALNQISWPLIDIEIRKIFGKEDYKIHLYFQKEEYLKNSLRNII